MVQMERFLSASLILDINNRIKITKTVPGWSNSMYAFALKFEGFLKAELSSPTPCRGMVVCAFLLSTLEIARLWYRLSQSD